MLIFLRYYTVTVIVYIQIKYHSKQLIALALQEGQLKFHYFDSELSACEQAAQLDRLVLITKQ